MEYLIIHVKKQLSIQTIGHDKINQLRHARFFGDINGLKAHMKKHAELLRPKFEAVLNAFDRDLDGLDVGTWVKPRGGYFISFDALPGCAKKIVAMCKDAGVVLTGAGATYPYGKDPRDRNIRIAPTFPSTAELQQAMDVLCVCIEIACIEKLLSA